MLALRPYQVKAVEDLRRAYSGGARAVCLAMATGAGKTVIFAHIASEAAKKGTRILILVHRRELLLQGSRALSEIGLKHGLIMPGLPKSEAQVRIASKDTLVRRLEHTSEPDLIICDESHHCVASSWARILSHWPKASILGVTATPARLDGRGLGAVFQKLVLGPSMRDLVRGGFLVPCDLYAPPVVADLAGMHTVGGDFDKHELVVRMDKAAITGDCVEHYSRLANGRLAVVFCVSIEHAHHVSAAFSAAGFPSEAIDGTMGIIQRDAILARFAKGETRVLTSCSLVSEGWDLPECEVAVLLRPTQSVAIYLQQVGRIMRPAEGKTTGIILDHVGNWERHGLPELEREWSLDSRKKKPRLPPIKRCPSCFAVYEGGSACPEWGYQEERPARGGVPEHTEGTLEKVSYEDVRQRMRRQAMEQGECQTMEELVTLGQRRGYSNPRGWAFRVWQGRQRLRA